MADYLQRKPSKKRGSHVPANWIDTVKKDNMYNGDKCGLQMYRLCWPHVALTLCDLDTHNHPSLIPCAVPFCRGLLFHMDDPGGSVCALVALQLSGSVWWQQVSVTVEAGGVRGGRGRNLPPPPCRHGSLQHPFMKLGKGDGVGVVHNLEFLGRMRWKIESEAT